ncbi:MAG: tetratricopeptide repeat protein [Myxococcales bacterium]|nr:tetratricopeptide repeat protein [Myxococcales bacterium]
MHPQLEQNVAAAIDAGHVEQAMTLLEEALRQQPAQPAAWAKLGMLRFRRDELDAALYAETEAIRYDGSAQRYADRAATYREMGLRQQQLADLSQAVALEPSLTKHRRERIWVLLKLGHYEQALADADQNAALAPKKAWVYSDRGRVLLLLGRYAEALAAMDEAIRRDPTEDTFHRFRSAILRLGGRLHEAVQAASCAITLGPDDGRNRRMRALALAELGHDRDAAADRAKAIQLENQKR